MKQRAAPMCTAIKVITGIVLVLTVAFLVAGFFLSGLFVAGALLAVLSLGCYLTAPVAYDVLDGMLLVHTRLGTRRFGPVMRCLPLDAADKPRCRSVRVWGNGGMFAGTGLFWSRQHGYFRAYVTRSHAEDLMWVETAKTRVLISPENPGAFMAAVTVDPPA